MSDGASLRAAERHLKGSDPVMATLVSRIGRCRLDDVQRTRGFEALTEAIVYQQLSMQAAATIHRRFKKVLGGRRPSPEAILACSTGQLRGAGLSRQKIGYLRDLAGKVKNGSLSLRRLPHLDDDEAIAALTRVKGIGRWTAQMYLIFRLGRLDVLPVDDLGVRDSARRLYGLAELPAAPQLERVAEPWRPYRSVACWYLWRARRGGGLQPES
ncbi:MAG: DNA-3-methyladenine glycosylase family protein [Acidobacteriota bacterium]